jgi:hypothetical protein
MSALKARRMVIGRARLPKDPLLSRSWFRLPAEQRFYVVKRAEPWSILGHDSARSWNWHIYRRRNACDVVRTLGLSGASPHQVGSNGARINQRVVVKDGHVESRPHRYAKRCGRGFRPTGQSPITNHQSLLVPVPVMQIRIMRMRMSQFFVPMGV